MSGRQNSSPLWAVTPEKIDEAVRRIVEVARPVKIILFGSHARSDADLRSDIDLLVIEKKVVDRYSEMVRLNAALRGLILPVDILAIGEDEFEEWAETPGMVYCAAKRDGKWSTEQNERERSADTRMCLAR